MNKKITLAEAGAQYPAFPTGDPEVILYKRKNT